MRIRAQQQIPWPAKRGRHTLELTTAIAALSLSLAACSSDPTVTCGTGTRLENNNCVATPVDGLDCGAGTTEMNGVCVANPVVGLECGAGTTEMNGVCVADAVVMLECGAGTVEMNGECVPADNLACGSGTVEVNGECISTELETGRFQSPVVLLQNFEGPGSHTDEVRIYGDLLLNCSYTFNVIDAKDPRDMNWENEDMERRNHTIPGDTRRPGCKHLAKDDNFVFTTHLGNIRNPTFLSGWDITDTENLVQLPVLQEPGISYEGVDVANHLIYVARHENGLGVYRYDTTSSTVTTSFVAVGTLGGFTNAWGIAARDNTVYIADGPDGLVTVDVTNPAAPVERGRVALGGFGRFVDVDGNYAYVAIGSEGVAIVDVSDLANPTLVSKIAMPGTAIRLDYEEGHVFVAAWNDVRVYNVEDPSAPKMVASIRVPRHYEYDEPARELPTMRIFGVAARGKDIFVGTWENPYSYRLYPEHLAPNIHLPETAARIDVGVVEVGTTMTIPYEITNQGTAPLTISDMWITNSSYTIEPSQAVLQPDETLTVDISFTAAEEGTADGFFYIFSDDPVYPIRKPYIIANGEGATIGTPLPATTATLLDGTPWNSSEAAGNVLVLTFFGTF